MRQLVFDFCFTDIMAKMAKEILEYPRLYKNNITE